LLHNHPHLSSGAGTIGQKWPQYKGLSPTPLAIKERKVTVNIDWTVHLYMYVLNFQSGNSGKMDWIMYLDLPELTKKRKFMAMIHRPSLKKCDFTFCSRMNLKRGVEFLFQAILNRKCI
jgi:hypothetical protein